MPVTVPIPLPHIPAALIDEVREIAEAEITEQQPTLRGKALLDAVEKQMCKLLDEPRFAIRWMKPETKSIH